MHDILFIKRITRGIISRCYLQSFYLRYWPFSYLFLSKWKEKIHTGYFVLLAPLAIFIYFVRFIGKDFDTVMEQYSWIPSLQIGIDFYLDGLSLLFVLLISGIGALVTFYSIFLFAYLRKIITFLCLFTPLHDSHARSSTV